MTKFAEQSLAGWCPACGMGRLHADVDGRIVCRYPGCPRPHAVHELLAHPQTGHVLHVDDQEMWTLRHPLIEELDGADTTRCPIQVLLAELHATDAAVPPGRYRIRTDVIHGVLYEPLSSQPHPFRGAGLSPAPTDPGG